MRTHVIFRRTWLSAALSATLLVAGCKSNPDQAQIINQPADGSDPAAANMAPGDGTQQQGFTGQQPANGNTQVLGTSAQYTPTQSSEQYPQQAAAPVEQNYGDQYAYDDGYDDGQQAVYAAAAPPPLPEYEQPEAPGDDYLWTPGYWGYADTGYYWVPGAWVMPPYVGALWTPGYWGWFGGRYRWHGGYWGRHIGYYGGINYGWGYTGYGYEGGYWRGRNFYYNRAVNRINVSRVHNVYEHPVTVNRGPRYSFNGPGGYTARPRANEVAAMREQRTRPMETQIAMHREAQNNRGNAFSQNHGRPAEAAFSRPIQRGAAAPLPAVRGGFGGNNGRPGEVRPGQPGFNPQQQRGLMERNQEQQNRENMQRQQQMQNMQRAQEQQRMQQQQQVNRGGFGNNARPGQPGVNPQQQRGLLQQNQGQVRQEQQRNQQEQQQRMQQAQQQRMQQQNLQQREQMNAQRQQGNQQREQMLQQRQQQNIQQQNVQREQMNAQRQQQNAQRGQMLEQRQQQMQQRQQQMQQRQARPEPMQRPAPAPHVEAQRPAPQPQHMEAPRAAPAPHMEAPHAAPAPAAPHGGGGGGGHPGGGGGHPGGHH